MADGGASRWACLVCTTIKTYKSDARAAVEAQRHADKYRHRVLLSYLHLIEPNPELDEGTDAS